MQAHPMYEENRRLRAENERLRGLIRENTRRNMRRYAEMQMRREAKKAFCRRMRICIGLMKGAVGKGIENAAWSAREIYGRLPLAAKCLLCAWAGAQGVVLIVQTALEMWCAWQI